ncbi:hypothetical protein [Sedimentibacter sp.]|uniref:hypothetical protein n=1 Tax=Sedimentibacter sp. TaxID=1960295 RepID=UPI00289DAA2B|nr:hypothetical protein [Sedimentibacter sp.]
MKSKIIIKTSVFPASEEAVFSRLKELKTLQYVAAPLVTFSALNDTGSTVWQKDQKASFNLKLFGVLPFGVHKIHVVEFDEVKHEIYTNETSAHIQVWNHRIILKTVEEGKTQYTDEVEIYAGWKTPLICLCAEYFYTHRQKRWIKLLQQNIND